MLGLAKAKLYAIGAAIISALLVTLKLLAGSRARAVRKAERLEATLKRQSDIQEMDNELEGQLSSRRAEIKKELKEDKSVKSLENPNEW